MTSLFKMRNMYTYGNCAMYHFFRYNLSLNLGWVSLCANKCELNVAGPEIICRLQKPVKKILMLRSNTSHCLK